jgi:CRP-like cAMP-binding protein
VLAKSDAEWTYEDGEVIVTEGEDTTEMFVIQRGAVRVTKRVGVGDVELALLERGNFFGEMSLLESLPRHATCRAVGRTTVLAIRSGDLLMKIRRDPTFAFEMLQRMSRRIRFLNDQVVALLERGQLSPERLAAVVNQSEFSQGAEVPPP